jgi:hypothetical protein
LPPPPGTPLPFKIWFRACNVDIADVFAFICVV